MTKILLLKIILPSFLLLYLATAQDHSHDICSSHMPYPLPMTIPPNGLTISDSTDCVKTFQIDLSDPSYAGKFLLIEFIISPFPNNVDYQPYLIGKKDSTPGLDNPRDYNNNANSPSYTDTSGYVNRKSYQYITVSANDNNGQGTYYIAFYRYFTDENNYYDGTVSYTVSVQASSTYQCPQGCSGPNQGTCDQNNQVCVCKEGFFDSDCSVAAIHMNSAIAGATKVLPKGWAYLYLPLGDFKYDVYIEFNKGNVAADYYSETIYGGSDNVLPSVNNDAYYQYLKPSTEKHSLYFYHDYWKDYRGQYYVFGLQNLDSQNTMDLAYITEVEKDTFGTVLFWFVVAIIICGFASCWVVSERERNNQLRRQQNLQMRQYQTRPATIPIYNQQVPVQTRPTTADYLTIEQLEEHFPKQFYDEINDKVQGSCSICLDDFYNYDECRKLFCRHVFHYSCIEEWLKNHKTCPNCNQLITLASIKEFESHPKPASTVIDMGRQDPEDLRSDLSKHKI